MSRQWWHGWRQPKGGRWSLEMLPLRLGVPALHLARWSLLAIARWCIWLAVRCVPRAWLFATMFPFGIDTAVDGIALARRQRGGTEPSGSIDASVLPFSIIDFGARNGTDSTIAIQAAATAAAGQGAVFIPSGTYLVSSAIRIPANSAVMGVGNTSVLRATGNNTIFDLNPASRSQITGLRFEAAAPQAAGSAIDFTNAGPDIWLDNIYFGNNLFISLNVVSAATAQGGIYFLNRLRWDVVSGCTNGIIISDGVHLVTDVFFHNVTGTAANAAGMTRWLTINNFSDTLVFDRLDFYQGTVGVVIGQAAAGNVTNARFNNVTIDSMSDPGSGFQVTKCQNLKFNQCTVQGCGNGVTLAANSLDVLWNGGTIHANSADGITALTGASRWTILGADITSNNQANGAFSNGISVGAGVSDWQVSHCRFNNAVFGGFQKYGLNVNAGASTRYTVTDNVFTGNITGPYIDSPGAGYFRGNSFTTGLRQGRAVLVGGTVVVGTLEVVAADNIQLTRVVQGGTAHGDLEVGAIVAGTSFTINAKTVLNALEANDTSTIFWEITH